MHNTPDLNVILVGVAAFIGAQFLTFDLTAEILNFGAFLGFMGVNAAVFWQYWLHCPPGRSRNFLTDVVLPLLGFSFCAIIWWGLASPAKIAGSIWLLIGAVVVGVRTRWYRRPLRLPEAVNYE